MIKTYADGRIAEITINSTAEPISADELVRLLIAHGVTTAKLVRTTQTAKESPLSAVCDPAEERAVIRP
jgi:arsenate reductase-like glutaredoxin family protein